jgi:23S rRNA (uracil1939-C5)-methyltransferase
MSRFNSTVEALAFGGRGIALNTEKKVFFIEGVWPGDQGIFEIIVEKKNYGQARLVELLKPSPERRSVIPCRYQGEGAASCGGCSWMIAEYPAQIRAKMSWVKELCEKNNLFSNPNFQLLPILESENEWSYRNRAQFKTDGKKVGFLAKGSHQIIDIEKCEILNSKMQKVLDSLRRELPHKEWTPRPPYSFRFLDVDDDLNFDGQDQIAELYELDQRRPFKQGNTLQNLKMRDWLMSELKGLRLSSQKTEAADLFCGAGNFTEILVESNCFEKVFAVEIASQSLQILAEKNIKNLEIVEGDLFQAKSVDKLCQRLSKVEILILDPPREGWILLDQLVQKLPMLKKIIYISCDAQTFFRDYRRIEKLGFMALKIQPIDLFPQTPHLELISVIQS